MQSVLLLVLIHCRLENGLLQVLPVFQLLVVLLSQIGCDRIQKPVQLGVPHPLLDWGFEFNGLLEILGELFEVQTDVFYHVFRLLRLLP